MEIIRESQSNNTTSHDMVRNLTLATGLRRWLLLLCWVSPAIAEAQSNTEGNGVRIVIGRAFFLDSDALGEERPIWVHTPPGYAESNQLHPVLYLLDGRAHFQHVAGVVDFLSSVGRIPSMIVVAVPNVTDGRTRDLTPTPTHEFGPDGVTPWRQVYPTAGGADDFRAFLTDELIPYIDSAYRTVSLRVLVGHSLGGLFNVHAFVSDPTAFRGHVIISPALWWDQQRLVAEADMLLQKERPAGFIYLTTANEGGATLSSAQGFSAVLEQYASDSLHWQFTHMDQESHVSSPHRSIYDGLEWMFQDWRFTPAEGADFAADARLQAIDERFSAISQTYGYEIPTPQQFLNAVGYVLLRRGATREAIKVFAENTARFPGSANVYDSLADAHRAAGNLLMARDNYAKAHWLAQAVGHPNTAYYKSNLDELNRQLASQ